MQEIFFKKSIEAAIGGERLVPLRHLPHELFLSCAGFFRTLRSNLWGRPWPVSFYLMICAVLWMAAHDWRAPELGFPSGLCWLLGSLLSFWLLADFSGWFCGNVLASLEVGGNGVTAPSHSSPKGGSGRQKRRHSEPDALGAFAPLLTSLRDHPVGTGCGLFGFALGVAQMFAQRGESVVGNVCYYYVKILVGSLHLVIFILAAFGLSEKNSAPILTKVRLMQVLVKELVRSYGLFGQKKQGITHSARRGVASLLESISRGVKPATEPEAAEDDDEKSDDGEGDEYDDEGKHDRPTGETRRRARARSDDGLGALRGAARAYARQLDINAGIIPPYAGLGYNERRLAIPGLVALFLTITAFAAAFWYLLSRPAALEGRPVPWKGGRVGKKKGGFKAARRAGKTVSGFAFYDVDGREVDPPTRVDYVDVHGKMAFGVDPHSVDWCDVDRAWFANTEDELNFAEVELESRASLAAKARLNKSQVAEGMLDRNFVRWELMGNTARIVAPDGQLKTSATVVGDKIFTVRHANVQPGDLVIWGTGAAAEIGEPLPAHFTDDDLVVFRKPTGSGVAKIRMRAPLPGETVYVMGFHPDLKSDESRPEVSWGKVAGVNGTRAAYTAPTKSGMCGGGVFAEIDGMLLGFHVSGDVTSFGSNRFIMADQQCANVAVTPLPRVVKPKPPVAEPQPLQPSALVGNNISWAEMQEEEEKQAEQGCIPSLEADQCHEGIDFCPHCEKAVAVKKSGGIAKLAGLVTVAGRRIRINTDGTWVPVVEIQQKPLLASLGSQPSSGEVVNESVVKAKPGKETAKTTPPNEQAKLSKSARRRRARARKRAQAQQAK